MINLIILSSVFFFFLHKYLRLEYWWLKAFSEAFSYLEIEGLFCTDAHSAVKQIVFSVCLSWVGMKDYFTAWRALMSCEGLVK